MERTDPTPHEPTQPAEGADPDQQKHPLNDGPATVEACNEDFEKGADQRTATFMSWFHGH
ncbi:hypothetical protein ACFQ6V_09010 [Streptomyces roseifaciens]